MKTEGGMFPSIINTIDNSGVIAYKNNDFVINREQLFGVMGLLCMRQCKKLE